MRVAIIGAGLAGVTSAYELAAEGHRVTVFERRGSVAAEGSFANAGFVVPGLALSWATPAFPAPFRPGFGWRFGHWRAARDKALPERQEKLLRLAQFSLTRLARLRRDLQLDYERAEGQVVLLRTAKDAAAIAPGLALLERAGIMHRRIDAEQCRALEPGLSPDVPLHGGVQLEHGEVGNARQFALQLRTEAQRLGAQFRFHTTVRSLTPGQSGAPVRLVHEHTPPKEQGGGLSRFPADAANFGDTEPMGLGPIEHVFDAVLVCAAFDAAALLAPLGVKLPLTPMHGYSITAPLRRLEAHPDLGPRAALWDQQRQIAIARIGQRVRVAGGIEFGGSGGKYSPAAVALLHDALHDWFPGAMQQGQVQRWKGAFALLPDGLPLIGASGLPGIWLNLAQGATGWPIACGAARALAGPMGGRAAEFDLGGPGGLDTARLA